MLYFRGVCLLHVCIWKPDRVLSSGVSSTCSETGSFIGLALTNEARLTGQGTCPTSRGAEITGMLDRVGVGLEAANAMASLYEREIFPLHSEVNTRAQWASWQSTSL